MGIQTTARPKAVKKKSWTAECDRSRRALMKRNPSSAEGRRLDIIPEGDVIQTGITTYNLMKVAMLIGCVVLVCGSATTEPQFAGVVMSPPAMKETPLAPGDTINLTWMTTWSTSSVFPPRRPIGL
jgi:hypothetical protein